MTGPQTAPRILLIDDDEELVAALSCALEHAGYAVRCAGNGAQGVRMAKEDRPELILMDLMMPVKKGFESCTEIWQDESLSDVPILVLTAFGQDIGETYGLTREHACGKAVDFLEKPVEINVLLDRIAKLITSSR